MIDPTRSPTWARSLAATQLGFADELVAYGFTRANGEQKWEGQLDVLGLNGATITVDIEIEIGDAFPFEPPKVTETSMMSARTWHHNPDWSLCLYGSRNVGDRPWQDPAQLLARVQDWFRNAAYGWPDDPPDLDIERYFKRSDLFVTYDDITKYVGRPVLARSRGGNRMHIVREGHVPRKQRSRSDRWWGWVGDIGELDAPVFDWNTLSARLGSYANKVEKRIRNQDYGFLALRYQRQGYAGVLVVIPSVQDRGIQLRAARSAAADNQTRRLRAGDKRTVRMLGRKKVAIVGVGAIGSFLADLLARSGIGRLHLVDHDILRPGNCIRHLAGYGHVGCHKTVAVRDVLANRQHMMSEAVFTTEGPLTPDLAADLLEKMDVVVDATADDNVRGLLIHLHDVAETHNIPTSVVAVAVHRAGGIVRSDRWPRTSQSAPAPIPMHPDGEPELRESGCGDPVSATPPVAVIEAAGLATRHIVDLLLQEFALPESVVQVLVPQPDPPYQQLGTIHEEHEA